jgi:hypothetical protein
MASSWFENFRAEVTSADEQVRLEAKAAKQRVVTIPILQVLVPPSPLIMLFPHSCRERLEMLEAQH